MATGDIFISEYIVTPTISGETTGSINVQDISGGTGPYTIQWYGPGPDVSTYALASGSSFNIDALSAGTYSGRVIDYVGLSADTEITVSAFTAPQFSASVTDNSCIDNPNLPCTFTVFSAGTPTAFQSAATYNYTLFRDGELVKSVNVSSATTSTMTSKVNPVRGGFYEFSGLTNGDYVFNISTISSHIQHRKNVIQSICTGRTVVDAGNSPNAVDHPNAQSLTTLTSAWTITNIFSPARINISPSITGGITSGYTTGIYKHGIVTDSPNHWLFTGNSQTGVLNYPQVNPNTGRTTSTNKNYYLGVTGATDMGEGYNWGPSGGGGHPLVDGSSKDLDGTTINGAAFDGMFYFNNNIQKFVIYRPLTGNTGSFTYGWQTILPSKEDNNFGFVSELNTNSGNPTSSLAITTNKESAFSRVGSSQSIGAVGGDATYAIIAPNDGVRSMNGQNVFNTSSQIFTGRSASLSSTTTSFVSSCRYTNYSYETCVRFTGTTKAVETRGANADIILAQIRDYNGDYGISGQTHQLILRISHTGTSILDNATSTTLGPNAATASEVQLQNQLVTTNALTIQRDLHGNEIVVPNTEILSDNPPHPTTITKNELTNRKNKFSEEVLFNYSKFVRNKEFNKDLNYTSRGLQTKQFDGLILSYPAAESSGDTHCSPYLSGGSATLKEQGAVRILVTRSGNEGEQFKIQMTKTMGMSSVQPLTSVNIGAINRYFDAHEMNFNLLDKTTWSGSSSSAAPYAKGDELLKYLGDAQIGFNATISQSGGEQGLTQYYAMGLTGNTGTTISAHGQGHEVGPIFSGTAFTLTSTANTNTITTKDCDFSVDCEYTIPKVKPQMKAIFQSLPEPDFDLSGGTLGNNLNLSGQSIYNLSADTGMDLNIFMSGNTADFLSKQAYLKLDIYPYEYSKEKFSVKSDYRYLFDSPAQVSTKALTTKTTPLSATTFFPFSAFSTGTSWQFLVKPSSIFRDKSDLNNNVYIDTGEILDTVNYDRNKDSIITLVAPPDTPSLINREIAFAPNSQARLETESFTVTGVPPFDGPQSGFTYSGITLNYKAGSSLLVTVNGVVVREEGQDTSYGTPDATFVTGFTDYNLNDYKVTSLGATQITFRERTVKDGDLVQVIYPLTASKSYYKQTFSVVSNITTNSAETIYKDSFYYYINLDYPALGAVALVYNGQILTENSDYQRVGDSLIQLISVTADNNDLGGCGKVDCSFTLYYLTQYSVVGRTTTSQPRNLVTFNKTLGFKESLKQIVYNSNTGEVVQEQSIFFKHRDYGVKRQNFIISVPNAGTYNYRVIATRHYPLLDGEEITTNTITPDVRFEISRQTFFSPYKLPGQRGRSQSSGGAY